VKAAGNRRAGQAGFTLIELIITTAIMMILAGAALPIARVSIQRQKEVELRRDRNQIQVKAGTEGYPPDLATLVMGVPLAGKPGERIRFLRKVPVDPMTGQKDWGKRCVQDDPDTNSWCGDDVFDVFSQSTGTALDGTKYADW
jgi:general secretion pathway protein G